VVPVSSRLAGVLEMAHTALVTTLPPALSERERLDHAAECFVFGDGAGRRVQCIRKAWDTAVLKAHGHKPVRVGSNTLAPESRASLHAIDLHFQDLRHEAGSRLHEAGWALHHVQHMLGHKGLEQTTTYLNVTLTGRLKKVCGDSMNPSAVAIPLQTKGGIERTPDRNGDAETGTQPLVN
jgi:integrase